jgi:hypothetical protein
LCQDYYFGHASLKLWNHKLGYIILFKGSFVFWE